MRTLGIVILSLAPAFARDFHAGIQAGLPLTEYFEAGFYNAGLHGGGHYSSGTRRYVLGAFAEWQPYRALGVQAGLLYHRIGYSALLNRFDSATGGFANSDINVYGNSWDFPLLGKYRFGRRFPLCFGAGGVLRYIGPVRGRGVETAGSLVTGASTTTPIDTSQPSDVRKRFYPGFTAAGGIEFPVGRLRIVPEIRYTRWLANISGPGGALRFAPNQVEFLIGFML